MSPLRALFLSLSKMPPIVMLLIIMGLSVVVTMMVTAKVDTQHAPTRDRSSVNQAESASTGAPSSRPKRRAYYSLAYLPAGATIMAKQVQLRNIDELELWEDAVIIPADVVGRAPKHAIPVNSQIRQIDLQ